jgi:imidazoleglycerol phosphate dehydratase HisB
MKTVIPMNEIRANFTKIAVHAEIQTHLNQLLHKNEHHKSRRAELTLH